MNRKAAFSAGHASLQRGVTTLVVVLSLLVILTLVILASSSVALFEQKTATNENRQKLADQAAEYALNMSGEWLKMNMIPLASARASNGGWLATGSTRRWRRCSAATVTPTHPCWAERNTARRNELWFYNFVDANTTNNQDLPYGTVTFGQGVLTDIGGDVSSAGAVTTKFPVTTRVNALLCRLDTTIKTAGVPTPQCRAVPNAQSEARVAVTLIANTTLPGESAVSQIKETWASYSVQLGAAAVPLIASGTVQGLGNAEIVAAPNGAGYGLPVSIWSPCPVDIEKSVGQTEPAGCVAPGGGIGSVSTCQLGEFLKNTPEATYKTACPASNNACGCPSFNTANSDFLSGHSNANKRESVDILDQDGGVVGHPVGKMPDINFFPGGYRYDGSQLDDPNDPLDDSLFEWIFAQDVVNEDRSLKPSSSCGGESCALVALRDELGAAVVANCNGFSSTSSGIYYVTGDCDFPNGTQVGSPTSPVIVVINGSISVQGAQGVRIGGNLVFYGMLFIRSDDNTALVTGNGNPEIYGSVVVEGRVSLAGGIRIVYDNNGSGVPDDGLIATTRFAKLPGSWLDSSIGF